MTATRIARPGLLAACLLALLAALVPAPAGACHTPDHLEHLEHRLTPEQLAMLSAIADPQPQIPYVLGAATPCVDGMADIFRCANVDLLAHLASNTIGGGNGNDVWGWVDPETGHEWALMGRTNGIAFVDVTDPENPLYAGNLPTHSGTSAWRNVKVFADHAFVVSDNNGVHGMQVFDLAQLRDVVNPPVTLTESAHYSGFNRSHNLAINEDTGFAYAVGSETCSGGLHIIDVNDPLKPTFAGCYSEDDYTHDTQCVIYQGPDVEHQGREICFASNVDTVTIVDVTVKSAPDQLSRTGYANSGYVHQGWLTADHRYFIHDDELDEMNDGHNTYTYVWDVGDLDAPVLRGHFTADGPAIDHNQFIHGGHTYQANYRRGLRILRINDPDAADLEEVAFFDTYPEGDGNSFNGAWSTYPYFPSGTVVVSDINRGLFVLRPRLTGIFEDGFESGDTSEWSGTVAELPAAQPGRGRLASGLAAGGALCAALALVAVGRPRR